MIQTEAIIVTIAGHWRQRMTLHMRHSAKDAEHPCRRCPRILFVLDGESSGATCPTSGTTGTLYWRGTGSDPLSESDLSGNMLEDYIFFNGQRIARRDVSTDVVHFYFSDHLGTHAVVENAGGTACEQDIDYYPYGGEEEDHCSTPVAQNYKFTGKERDSESGLDMFGARYHGSSLGRFMTTDGPLIYASKDDPQSWNLYSYVQNDPLNRIDPNGHLTVIVPGTWASANDWNLNMKLVNEGRVAHAFDFAWTNNGVGAPSLRFLQGREWMKPVVGSS